MGVFGKKDPTETLFGPTVTARIKALETGSRGAVRGPKEGYFQSLISKTPQDPTLRVVALKRNGHDTVIAVGMAVPGETEMTNKRFSIKGLLTPENAMATGASIARLLGDHSPAMAVRCGEKLKELTAKPEGQAATFQLDEFERLAITDGGR